MDLWKLCVYMGNATSAQSGGVLESCCCFVIHYTDKVSKYRVDWNYQDEANGLHFLRSVDFALLKYFFCFLLEPQKIFLWFSYHHFLCIIYCMIRNGISYVEISLSFMVTWTEKEMYLSRPLSLHVKPISLFCMQIHSSHMTRDRLCFCVVLAQGH